MLRQVFVETERFLLGLKVSKLLSRQSLGKRDLSEWLRLLRRLLQLQRSRVSMRWGVHQDGWQPSLWLS